MTSSALRSRRRIVRSATIRYKMFAHAAAGFIAFTIGLVGLNIYDDARGSTLSALDLVYLDLKMLAFGGAPEPPLPVHLEVARFLLPAVVLSGALSGFIALFRDRYQQVRLPFLRGHVLIAGLGEKGLAFTRAMRIDGESVVAIDADPSNPNVAAARDIGATVLLADATDEAVLVAAGIRRAKQLIATADDATNAEVTLQTERLVSGRRRRGSPLAVLTHVIDPDLCRLLSRQGMEAVRGSGRRLDFFNVYEQSARIACRNALAGFVGAETIVVIGDSPLVEHIVIEIAARWSDGGGGPRQVTMVHPSALTELATMRSRHPILDQRVAITAVERPLDAPLMGGAGLLENARPGVVFVCAAEDSTGVEVALSLKVAAREAGFRIVVCANRSGGLASVLTGDTFASTSLHGLPPLERITVLALCSVTCTHELVRNGRSEQLARAVHDDYVQQRRARRDLDDGDPALAPWEELMPDFKQSSREQADDIVAKLHAIGCDLEPSYALAPSNFAFTADEIERLSVMEHERWVAERSRAGWTLGPTRDARKRRSPDLVPWDDLTEESREKDREAIRRIPILANLAGFDVYRLRQS